MYKFNLNEVDNDNLKIVEDYLNDDKISPEFLEHFAEISFYENFYTNTNNDYLLDITELSIIHYDIFLKNELIIFKLLEYKTDKNIVEILQNSIKEELITRFKNKIENSLNKDDYKIDKIKKL